MRLPLDRTFPGLRPEVPHLLSIPKFPDFKNNLKSETIGVRGKSVFLKKMENLFRDKGFFVFLFGG
jgi:hypothetical protein